MIRIITLTLMWLLLALAGSRESAARGVFELSPFETLAREAVEARRTGSDPSRGNSLIILNEGYDALLLRLHLIRNAQRSINVQTYIWVNDECGRLLMYELIQAAKRGVKVRIIVDSLGAEENPEMAAFLATAHPNLKIKHYRPVAGRVQSSTWNKVVEGALFFRDTNQRMHNKVMTFDDVIGITGGRNIQNVYFDFGLDFNFKDRDAAVIGPVVRSMTASFEKFWDYKHAVPTAELKDVAAAIRADNFPHYGTWNDFEFGGWFDELSAEADDAELIRSRFLGEIIEAERVEFAADLPGKKKTGFFGIGGEAELTERMFALADVVNDQLVIQSPYLVLDKRGKDAFKEVRKRGIQTIISSNSFGAADHIVTYSANYRMRSFYVQELGFEIYEFKPYPGDLHEMVPHYADLERRAREQNGNRDTQGPSLCIHAKSFVLDGYLAYIGSYNLDPRSGNLNTEVGLFIEDEEVAGRLREDILRDTAPRNSWVIARREGPLADVNELVESVSGASPVDVWPVKNTTSFELVPGARPVPPSHDQFYEHYRDIGSFPGVNGVSDEEILARIMKAFGKAATPLL